MNSQFKTPQPTALFALVLPLIFSLISACISSPTPTTTISRDKAIEIAISGCKTPHLVLVGQPQNIQTKLLTLEEADKATRAAGETTSYGIPMDTKVWLVQMDGQLQLVGGPVPVITEESPDVISTPPQPFWGTCSVILDASSGAIILVRG